MKDSPSAQVSPAAPAPPPVDYRTLFDCIADAVLVVDRETGRFLDCNRTALERYGYTQDELLDRTPYDLHLPEDRALVDRILQQPRIRSGNQYRHRTRDGFLMDVEIRSEPIEYNGRPAWLAIVRDIGDRLRREEQVCRAKDEAERASRAKSDFLAKMSHEIRTPMNGVIGMSEILLHGQLTPEQRECATTIHGCATSLLTIIDDILDFSRMEQGRMVLSPDTLDLCGLAEGAVEPVALRAAQKGLELVVDVGVEAPPRVVGDPVRLRQIVTNLVSNAVKFTDRGQVVLRVRRDGNQSPPAGHCALRFEVSDTGPGIAPEKQRVVFDPFVQADASFARRVGGTGLGLAICRQLVELMGGHMGLESTLGAGSTFWFTVTLPLPPDAPSSRRPPADLAGVRVLLIGLPDATQRMVERRLHGWSIRAATATVDSAAQLVRAAIAAHQGFGAALLDESACAGGAAGVGSLVDQLRAVAGAEQLGVVLLVHPGLRGTPGGAGPSDVTAPAGTAGLVTLGKPVRLAALEQQLRKALGRTPSGAVAARPAGGAAAVRASGSIPSARPSGSTPAVDHTPLLRDGRPLRVLVAEDNPVNARVIVFMLEAWGVHVECVEDGAVAVARTAAGQYDAVLMDWQMPGMDGRQATEAIRAREHGTAVHVPIVGLTANAMQGDRQRCLAAGMDDYLPKPFRAPQLRAVLQQWTTARP